MKNILSWLLLSLLLLGALQYSYAESEDKLGILHPKGLLWKIEKPGTAPSYLYGTMHVADLRVTQLSPQVEQAFMQAGHFVMEVVMNFEAMSYINHASFFHDGRRLQDFMGQAEYKRLIVLLKQRLLMPEDAVKQMKPWAVLMLLMMPASSQMEQAVALDLALYQRAVKRKVQLTGLETVQEQIAVFESMSLQDQLWMLNRSIKEINAMDEQVQHMLTAYVARDLAELVEIQQSAMDKNSAIEARFIYQLLELRNVRMVERMPPILKQGNAFIAIGALHLPGKTGVLHLLEQQGYNVTAIY